MIELLLGLGGAVFGTVLLLIRERGRTNRYRRTLEQRIDRERKVRRAQERVNNDSRDMPDPDERLRKFGAIRR